jgi:hypothetical protein
VFAGGAKHRGLGDHRVVKSSFSERNSIKRIDRGIDLDALVDYVFFTRPVSAPPTDRVNEP